jgi:RHS repeat-associated protein
MCAVLVVSSISVPAVAASSTVSGNGTSGNGATLNKLPSVVAASTLPLKFIDSASGAEATVRTATVAPTPPKTKTEIPSKRTERSRTYANPDGTYTLEASPGRINYKDASGNWQPIDTTLIASTAGSGWDLGQKANDKQVLVSTADPSSQLAQMSVGSYTITLREPGFKKGSVQRTPNGVKFGGTIDDTTTLPSPTPSAEPSATPTVAPTATPAASGTASPTPSASASATSSAPPAASSALGGGPALNSDPSAGGTPSASSTSSPDSSASPSASPSPSPSPTASSSPTATSGASDSPTAGPSANPSPAASASPTASASPNPTPGPSSTIDVTSTPEGLELSAEIASATSPTSYSVAIDPNGLIVSIDPDGLSIDFTDPSASDPTALVGQIGLPQLRDANNVVAPPSAVTVSLDERSAKLKKGEVLLTYSVSQAWLALSERAFPVVLDPSMCMQYQNSSCATDQVHDTFVYSTAQSGQHQVGWTVDRVGNDNDSHDAADGVSNMDFGLMESDLWFQYFPIDDGATVTSATLYMYQYWHHLNGTPQIDAYLNTSGFNMQTGWTNKPSRDTTISGHANACSSSSCGFLMDITHVVRAWYTRNPKDWKPDLGLTLALDNPSLDDELQFENYTYGTVSQRPKLTVNYDLGSNSMTFDPGLGPDFAPSAMVANGTTMLPVIVKNNSGLTWGTSTSSPLDYWSLGYRWYDAKGNVATPAGATATQLSSNLASGSSQALNVNVLAPPAGQYTLRLDVERTVSNVTALYMSDWATPSKYFARAKVSASPTNVKWGGTSVVERNEYSINVIAGGGGESKTVSLPDGGQIGIDLYARNLTFNGSTGLGFDDLATNVGVAYSYNSAAVGAPVGTIGAAGWYTSWDERIEPGTGAAPYLYRDASGSPSVLSYLGDGGMSGVPGGRLDRPRVTVFDENKLPGTWTGSTPSFTTTVGYNSSSSYSIAASNTGGSTTNIAAGPVAAPLNADTAPKISLNNYPSFSFEVKTDSASGAAIGIKIEDQDRGLTRWFIYTVGTDTQTFSNALTPKNISGSPAGAWTTATTNLNLLSDAVTAFHSVDSGVSANDNLVIDALGLYGASGSGNVYFDSVKFEGSATALWDTMMPAWTANPGNASTAPDHDPTSGNSFAVAVAGSVDYAHSPDCAGCSIGGQTNGALGSSPYVRWSWRKAGGNTVAVAFHVQDANHSSKSGTITYYAGPVPPVGANNPVQVSPTVPSTWTQVTRNLLEDSREVLGFYTDADASGDGQYPNFAPSPDDVNLTGYSLIAADGSAAYFDLGSLQSIPLTSSQVSDFTTADFPNDDFVATFAGGTTHRFNADGRLTRIVDLNGNTTKLVYSDDGARDLSTGESTGARYALTTIIAPSDTSSSVRRIAVSHPSSCAVSGDTCVRFTENLGPGTDTGRYSEFDLNGTDLAAVVPARLSGACATSGASGCVQFTYSNHLLNDVLDPRNTGTNNYDTQIEWTGTPATPATITDHSTGAVKLRINSFNNGAGGVYIRPAWQDADNVVSNTVRMADFSPNGSTYREWAPVACGSACSLATPLDLLSVNETDGRDQLAYEIRYQTAQGSATTPCTANSLSPVKFSCGNPIVTRRGTYASYAVDSYPDALTGSLTSWSQTANQYAASMAALPAGTSDHNSPDLYRTTYLYNGLGQTTDTIVPNQSQTSTYAAQVKSTPGIRYYYRLDGSGPNMPDSIGGPTATASGTYTGNATGALVNDANGALTFPTGNSTGHVTSTAALSGAFSFESWVWIDPSAAATSTLGIAGSRGANDYDFDLKVLPGGVLHADIGNGTIWLTQTAEARISVAKASWYHIVLTATTIGYTLYANGLVVGAGTYTSPGTPLVSDASHPLNIGYTGTASEYWQGGLDEVALYSGVMSARQVAAHYAAAGAVVLDDQQVVYDAAGNPTQALDDVVSNAGFESGRDAWGFSSGASSHVGPDSNVNSGVASAKLDAGASVSQTVGLVPGQTFRLQAALQETGTSSARINISYEPAGGGSLVSLASIADPTPGSGWHQAAWDVTVPMDGSGRISIQVKNTSGGSLYADDVAAFTTYKGSTYGAHGLLQSSTDVSGHVTNYEYGSPSSYGQGTNLLSNGGFASGTTGWTLATVGATADALAVSTSDDARTLRDGDTTGYSLNGANGSTATVHVTASSSTGVAAVSQTASPITVGHTYSLSGLVAEQRLTCAHLRLYFLNSSGSHLGLVEAPCTNLPGGPDRGTWAYQTLSAVAPANAVSVVVAAESDGPLTSGSDDGYLFADQLRLVDGTTPEPYIADAAVTPAIFPTRVTADYVANGTGADQNAASIAAYDRWGRQTVAIDPDGIGSMTQYAANATDVATTSDGLGDVTRTLSWDPVGHALTSADALGNVTTTVYGFFDGATDVTAPDGTVSHVVYNGAGRPAHTYSNYFGDGSDHSGIKNVETSNTYDSSGNAVATVADDGGIAATTQTDFNLQGTAVKSTVHDGTGTTGTARATTTRFDAAGNAAGVTAAIAPTSGAHQCPDGSNQQCNSVTLVDLNGHTVDSYNGYNVRTHSLYDLDGNVVRSIANYLPGVGYTASQNVVTDTTYDAAGKPTSVKQYLVPADTNYSTLAAATVYQTSTSYDGLDRSVSVVKADSSWIHTGYTKAGRTDRTSRAGGVGQTDSDVAWTMNVYDAAGRQTTTLNDYDISGHFGYDQATFEAGSNGWDAGGSTLLTGGLSKIATASGSEAIVHTGSRSLTVDAAGSQGAEWSLAGSFQAHHTYAATVDVHASGAGQTFTVKLGADATGASVASASATAAQAGWIAIPLTWTPDAAPAAGSVKLAVVNSGSSPVTFSIDDASVWDTTQRGPSRPNPANVPSSVTVFDARGKVVESIAPPDVAGGSPEITASSYDELGRTTSVTVNAVSGSTAPAGHGPGNDVNLTTTYQYDALSRKTDSVDPAGHDTHLVYDRRGNATEADLVWDGTVSTVGIRDLAAYDALNEVLATCTPNAVAAGCNASNITTSNRAWRYTYDVMGRQLTATPPVNTFTALASSSSTYEPGGHLVSTVSSDGTTSRTSVPTYDALGRTTSSVVTQTALGSLTTTVSFDSLGRQTRIATSGTSVDTLDETYDALGRLLSISRASTPITAYTYNPDGTAATRTDNNTYSYTFAYTALGQLASSTLPNSEGTASYAWGLDGNMTSRTWGSAAIAGTYLYDAAKRPVGLYIRLAGATSASVLARTYDVAGNVTSETQNLAGVGGGAGNATLAGSGTETFTYDAANRVVAAGFGAPGAQTETRAYTYDADSNRTSVTESGVTVYYFYDASDALVTKSLTNTNPNPGTSCTSLGFCYDAFGDLTSSSPSGPDASSADDLVVVHTNYSYDPAGHLSAITDGTSADAVSFTIDALGRHGTQTIGSEPTSTYAYLGTSYSITTIANSAGTTYSTIDAIGDRLASGAGAAFGWIVPDLHGNVVAAIGPDATFVNAYRYDPYGQTVCTWTATSGSVNLPWRYQGRILESAGTSTSTALYDFQARSYDPSLGGFTSFDSVSGSAQNPLTLNRYLYANANPATLVDPDGHSTCYSGYCPLDIQAEGAAQNASNKKIAAGCPVQYCGTSRQKAVNTAADNAMLDAAHEYGFHQHNMQIAQQNQYAAQVARNAGLLGQNGIHGHATPHCNDVFGCANDFVGGFGDGVVNFIPDTVNGFKATLQNDANCLTFSSGCNLQNIFMPGESMLQASIHQAATGDFRDLGHTAGNITTGIVVGAAVGAAADALLAGLDAAGAADAAVDATRVGGARVPSVTQPAGATTLPGEGWTWRGPPDKGSWYNPATGESLHPDLSHPDPVGPHWDYKVKGDPGNGYRWFPDGRMEPK